MTARGGGRVRGGVAGERGFFRWSQDATQIVLEQVRPIFETAAAIGHTEALVRVPVRTGNLMESIEHGTRMLKDRLEAYVSVNNGNTAPYWQYVEYGTGARGADNPGSGPVASQGYSHGESSGMPARPYMRPALIAMREFLRNRGQV